MKHGQAELHAKRVSRRGMFADRWDSTDNFLFLNFYFHFRYAKMS